MPKLPRVIGHCVVALLTACGNSTQPARDSVVDTVTTTGDRFDTTFIYNGGHPRMMIYRNDSLLRTCTFEKGTDTTFYADGCVHEITVHDEPDFEEEYFRYDHDHVLRFSYTLYAHDGFGGMEANRETYDTTGVRTTSEYNKDYMPTDAEGHLDLCGVVTTTSYYRNGNTKSIEHRDYHYEGGAYCPCGAWEYRDSLGNVTKREQYKKCGDGETHCVEE